METIIVVGNIMNNQFGGIISSTCTPSVAASYCVYIYNKRRFEQYNSTWSNTIYAQNL